MENVMLARGDRQRDGGPVPAWIPPALWGLAPQGAVVFSGGTFTEARAERHWWPWLRQRPL